jgi:molecular chaperone GrpE
MCGLFPRPSPRLLCTATKQKNNGQNLDEDLGHCEPKTDPPSADKTLLEEKAKLEEQLRETMVRTLRVCSLLDCCLHGPSSQMTEQSHLFNNLSTSCCRPR